MIGRATSLVMDTMLICSSASLPESMTFRKTPTDQYTIMIQIARLTTDEKLEEHL